MIETGILYAIDAKIAVLIKITVEDGITSAVSRGADVVLEADVTEGMVRIEMDMWMEREHTFMLTLSVVSIESSSSTIT